MSIRLNYNSVATALLFLLTVQFCLSTAAVITATTTEEDETTDLPSATADKLECNFEDAENSALCIDVTVDDQVKWTVSKASTTPGSDLPKIDGDGNEDGSYAYLEVSNKIVKNSIAVMVTPRLPVALLKCLNFQYCLFGTQTVLPKLIVVRNCPVSSTEAVLWETDGRSQSVFLGWRSAMVQLSTDGVDEECELLFLAQTASNWHQGVVAIDSIMTGGSCTESTTLTTVIASSESSNMPSTQFSTTMTADASTTADIPSSEFETSSTKESTSASSTASSTKQTEASTTTVTHSSEFETSSTKESTSASSTASSRLQTETQTDTATTPLPPQGVSADLIIALSITLPLLVIVIIAFAILFHRYKRTKRSLAAAAEKTATPLKVLSQPERCHNNEDAPTATVVEATPNQYDNLYATPAELGDAYEITDTCEF